MQENVKQGGLLEGYCANTDEMMLADLDSGGGDRDKCQILDIF